MNTSFISKFLSKQIFEAKSWESRSISTAGNIIFVPFGKRNRDVSYHVKNILLSQITVHYCSQYIESWVELQECQLWRKKAMKGETTWAQNQPDICIYLGEKV